MSAISDEMDRRWLAHAQDRCASSCECLGGRNGCPRGVEGCRACPHHHPYDHRARLRAHFAQLGRERGAVLCAACGRVESAPEHKHHPFDPAV